MRSLRAAAAQADQELAAAGRKEEKLADCVDLMRKLYTPLDSIHGDPCLKQGHAQGSTAQHAASAHKPPGQRAHCNMLQRLGYWGVHASPDARVF